MASYLVERYLPGLSHAEVRAAVQRLRAVSEQMTAEGTTIRYLSSSYLPEEESCFCQVEAPSREAVAAANERAAFPYARIHAVRSGLVASAQPSRTKGGEIARSTGASRT